MVRAVVLLFILSASCMCEEVKLVPDVGLPIDTGAPDRLPPDRPLRAGDSASLKGPPYPIVLAHGFVGFAKVGPLEYFHKVKQTLTAAGHTVEVTAVDPFNTSHFRGEQLLKQIHALLLRTHAARVNIIGHSQGGLDARYVASKIPDRIGAVVSVGTPHHGSKVADVLLQRTPGYSVDLAKAFFDLISRPFYGDISKDGSVKIALEFLSTDGLYAFNQAVPEAAGLSFFSIGGRSNSRLPEKECAPPPGVPAFISKWEAYTDPMDSLLFLSAQILNQSPISPQINDGLVQVSSMKWGTWLGCIPADHLDEIGQLVGDHPGLGNPFDHLTFYKDLARFLVDQGL